MNRYFPWTLSLILFAFLLIGSVALASKQPQEEPKAWFTPPPIFEDALGDWADQELCYYVIRQEGRYIPLFYRVAPAYPTRKGQEWMLPPLVIQEERRSVWRTLTDTLNRMVRGER